MIMGTLPVLLGLTSILFDYGTLAYTNKNTLRMFVVQQGGC